jgi:hypothetical protein
VLRRPNLGFGLEDPMPYGRIDEWVFCYNGRYVTGLWDCDEELMRSHECGSYGCNYAQVETNGWNQLDHRRRDGSRPEMDRRRRWIAAGDGSWPEMDCSRKWIAAGDGFCFVLFILYAL